jgi:hypothetical protein
LEEFALAFRLEISGGSSYHPDLSIGRVWAHLESSCSWVELLRVFSLLVERGIFQLEESTFRSTVLVFISHSAFGGLFCIDRAFCSSSYFLSIGPFEDYSRSALYCIGSMLLIIKGQIFACVSIS